jgi:hypothetical protein
MSDVDAEDNMDALDHVGFLDSQYMCVDIKSFFGAGACFMLSVKTKTQQALRSRLESSSTHLAKLATKNGWSYLTSENLNKCIDRRARRLKSGSGSSGSGSQPGYRRTGGVIVGGGVIGGDVHGYRRRRGSKEEECHVIDKDNPKCKESSFDEEACNDASKAEYTRNKACYDCTNEACVKSICAERDPDENQTCPEWNSCCECPKKIEEQLRCEAEPCCSTSTWVLMSIFLFAPCGIMILGCFGAVCQGCYAGCCGNDQE